MSRSWIVASPITDGTISTNKSARDCFNAGAMTSRVFLKKIAWVTTFTSLFSRSHDQKKQIVSNHKTGFQIFAALAA